MGKVSTAEEVAKTFRDKSHDVLNGSQLRAEDLGFPGQIGNMSLNRSAPTISTSIEKVPDKGWKNVFIKGLKIASSWGRPVKEDHNPSSFPGQLKTFSLDEGKSQTRISPKKNDLKVSSNLEAGASKVPTKKDNARQTAKALGTGPVGMILLCYA